MVNTVVFVANRGYALTSSRKSIITLFIKNGWTVVLATADDSDSRSLVDLGANLEPIVFRRGGISLISDFVAFDKLSLIFKKWQPKLIQQFHAKPAILGTLSARKVLGKSVRIVNSITGLGNAFVGKGIAVCLAEFGYSLAIPKSDIVVFQNSDDKKLFLDNGWVSEKQVCQITSSGVDLTRFHFIDRSNQLNDSLVVIMLSRLLKQKGIREFIQIAHRVREQMPQVNFILAGEEEANHPDGLTADWVSQQEAIKYLGRLEDVKPLLTEAALFLFPSYYREGVPRVILEASATGIPTAAFDEPGIREAVVDKVTGFLVPNRNLDELTARVLCLLENHADRLSMGLSARYMVEKRFDVHLIEQQYLDLYRELGLEI